MKPDTFTFRRLAKFCDDYRQQKGLLPTLADLEAGGFEKKLVASAVKEGWVEELYVTLTNGSVMKGFKKA